MNQQFNDITMWQRKVFPHATVESCAAHLKDEIEEIIEAHQNKQEIAFLSAELADAYILLIGMVDRAGLDLKDLYTAVEAKMEINKRRVWGKPDERGVVKHIEDDTCPHVSYSIKTLYPVMLFSCNGCGAEINPLEPNQQTELPQK